MRRHGLIVPRVFAGCRAIQTVCILKLFRQPLKHRQRLAEIYRHGDFGEIFPYAVLHDAPEIQTVVWFGRDHGSPDPAPARNSGGFSCHQLGLPIPLGITVGISLELRFYTCCRLFGGSLFRFVGVHSGFLSSDSSASLLRSLLRSSAWLSKLILLSVLLCFG